MFTTDIALQTLVVSTVLLVLLFVFLLTYTYRTRRNREYWQEYERQFRDKFFPIILDYAEQKAGEVQTDQILAQIKKRSKDYAFFLKLLDDLVDILEGEERNRLNGFIEHRLFLSFYKKKLIHGSHGHKIFACIYFQHVGNVDKQVLEKLNSFVQSEDLKLAYSAAKALQGANDIGTRQKALAHFFSRSDISELMVTELLHLFDLKEHGNNRRVSQGLRDLLLSELDVNIKSVIVRYMGHNQMHDCSEFLLEYLRRIQNNSYKTPLIRSLIISLGELKNTEAIPIIKNHIARKDANLSVTLASIKALSKLGGVEEMDFLTGYLMHSEFAVRKAIIFELAFQSEERVWMLDRFCAENLDKIRHFQKNNNLALQLQDLVLKVKDVASGIHIALNHRSVQLHG
jgi:hypothetical protein